MNHAKQPNIIGGDFLKWKNKERGKHIIIVRPPLGPDHVQLTKVNWRLKVNWKIF